MEWRNGEVIIYIFYDNFIVSWTGTLMKRFSALSDAVKHLWGVDFKICMKPVVDLKK